MRLLGAEMRGLMINPTVLELKSCPQPASIVALALSTFLELYRAHLTTEPIHNLMNVYWKTVPNFTGVYGDRFFVRRPNPDWTMRFSSAEPPGNDAHLRLGSQPCVAFPPQGGILWAGPQGSRLFDTVEGSGGRIGAA